MTLVKFKRNNGLASPERSPWFSSVFDLVDNLFTHDVPFNGELSFSPAANISETADAYRVELAIPGISKKDIRVEFDNGLLTISGERKEEKKEENKTYSRQEFIYGSFKRSFTVPETVDFDRIKAEVNDGLLILILPKKEEAKPRTAREIKVN